MELPELPDESALRARLTDWGAQHHLTPRELDLVIQLHLGFRDKHIAHNLGIALTTVSTELRSLYRKIGVTSRNELVALCLGVLLEGGG
jgi:DNA-binding NarL/FixJ family response regulator